MSLQKLKIKNYHQPEDGPEGRNV